MLNSNGKEVAVGGPTVIPSPPISLSPSELNQVIIGVDWIPSSSTASHTTSYISPATVLPSVVIDAFTAFPGTVKVYYGNNITLYSM